MQSRRELGSAMLAVICVSGCDDLVRVEQKPRLYAIRISLPPEQTAELMLTLELFARRHRFAFSSDSTSASTGTSRHFQLRRDDLLIDGSNPLSDDPEVRFLPDGTPSMAIDEGTLEVGFFAGRVQPSDTELDALVLDFIATVQTVEGATAAERPSETRN